MQSKPENWDWSIQGICSQTKDGYDGVASGLKELEKAGLLTREKYNTKDGFSSIYTLRGFTDSPSGKSPDGKSPSGKIPCVSKKELSKKELSNYNVEIQRIYDLYLKTFKKNPSRFKLTDQRKTKIRSRIKDMGYDVLERAIINTSKSKFHMGDNDRKWKADLDFIIRSAEQTERLSNLVTEEAVITKVDNTPDLFKKMDESNLARSSTNSKAFNDFLSRKAEILGSHQI